MAKFGMGQSVRRVEDVRLITGTGKFTDDINLPRQAFAYFLRSPHAHARIKAIDVAAAKGAPGVVAVFTGKDLIAAGLGNVPCLGQIKNRDGQALAVPPRPCINAETVKYVGDTVALVVAESLAAARDAAELIEVDYDVLPAVVDTAGALKPGAAQVWPATKNNMVIDWELGEKDKTDALFKQAKRVVRVDLVNNRVVPSSMEPRVAMADYDPANEKFTLYVASQGGHGIRGVMAKDVLKIPENKLRVVTTDVGGGFGMKIFSYPEYGAALHAARMLKRPIKWTPDRSDAFLTDTHGRDHVSKAEVALDGDGRMLAIRVHTVANLGAYLSQFGPYIPTVVSARMLPGVYGFQAMYAHVQGVFTNTAPVDAYRGAGRPEAAYLVERVVDAAARALGIGPDEMRRRNFITSFPATTPGGVTYDSGDFNRNMGDAMKAADWAGFADRRAASERAGKLRGLGMAYYIEACGGAPDETARVVVEPSGDVIILVGNQTNGQGHETAYMQLINERLGVPFEKIRVIQGDTDVIDYGRGTGGSRALSVGGSAVLAASDQIIAKGRKIAAHAFETAEADIEFKDARFVVVGTDRALDLGAVAALAANPAKLPAGTAPGLDEKNNFAPAAATYPNGCHIVEVEIDRATGVPTVDRYTIVDDFGKVINPLLVAGQVHGGTVQGIGQALYERTVYDTQTGQLVTGSFMDYCMPRADNVPDMKFSYNEIPCSANPLGVKGCGEAGAIGAPPAIINALVDALAPFGVSHIDMPATPEKIWGALAGAHQAAE